ncbi:MAG: GMC family oxidoreductase N-terminal domain-containing protein [Actinobacteria bacterium]|nr:GMC family oxidoreductase N-terminal domain-containing protein [Actinomycetota bacterium]
MLDAQLATLRALCDTFVPPVEPPAVEAHDPTGFWARRASDLGIHSSVALYVETELAREDRDGMVALLDALGKLRFASLPQRARETLLRTLGRVSTDAAAGIAAYRGLTLLLFYGATGDDGRNPNWAQLGYPGPPTVEPGTDRLETWTPPGELGPIEVDADVVVVGSGAGGGVIAAALALGGLDVLVLEAGGHLEDADFPADEAAALAELYWRGGPTVTADGNVAILAGATLGGGTTINWQNCVRPPAAVRDRWADEFGLDGLDDGTFDAHLDAVSDRISATTACSDHNGPNARLAAGAEALGWSWQVAARNTDPGSYDPETAGHVGYGDRTGSKRGTLKTYLRDAVDAGARVLPHCEVLRVTTGDGRATGVEAERIHADGSRTPVRVRAPRVVLAAGALETPAVLLRSRIGGPAVGRYLRLHPVPNLPGFYAEPQDSWWGPPQTCIVDEHRDVVAGHGYLVETPHVHAGLSAATVPWRSGRDHKLLMGRASQLSTFIAVTRDHGSGTVTLDELGHGVVTYPLDDPLDAEVRRHALGTLIDLHVAAGADVIVDLHPERRLWRRGDDLDAFRDRLCALPDGAGGRPLFSAHQMGTARMGTDRVTTVADPEGQLHDTAGVWIGDTSAFPTAVGSNPMLTCMALARRTAGAILAAS